MTFPQYSILPIDFSFERYQTRKALLKTLLPVLRKLDIMQLENLPHLKIFTPSTSAVITATFLRDLSICLRQKLGLSPPGSTCGMTVINCELKEIVFSI